ncbi:MAG: type IV pilus modification PilV family protein [Candidatus Rokuibacteriota bacterium]
MFRVMRNAQGMSLAEVLVALTVIPIGLVALLSAVPIASYAIQEGKQLSTATFLANQRLEQIRNAQWVVCPATDDLGLSPSATAAPQSSITAAVTFPDESALPAPYTEYSRRVRITDLVASTASCPGGLLTGTTGRRQATVTVSYRPLTGVGQAGTGVTKSAIVTMEIAQR